MQAATAGRPSDLSPEYTCRNVRARWLRATVPRADDVLAASQAPETGAFSRKRGTGCLSWFERHLFSFGRHGHQFRPDHRRRNLKTEASIRPRRASARLRVQSLRPGRARARRFAVSADDSDGQRVSMARDGAWQRPSQRNAWICFRARASRATMRAPRLTIADAQLQGQGRHGDRP